MREFSGDKLKQKGFFHSAGALVDSMQVAGEQYSQNMPLILLVVTFY
jgi:hypothetical protein